MNASIDENSRASLIATLNTDGNTIVRVCADSSVHTLCVSDGTTGSDNGPSNAPIDENGVPALIAVSSVDGVTPVVVYADSDGNLLIDSN